MTGITKEEMRRKLGNITQLRELLFGEQIEEYENKFEESFQRLDQLNGELNELERKFSEFRADIRQQLYQVETNLEQKITSAVDSLEKKIQYLNLNTRNETKRLHQEIEETAQSTTENIDAIADNLESQAKFLKYELSQTQENLQKDLQSIKQKLTEKIEKNLLELSEGKVSRSDLAEVLFDLCLKIKGTGMASEAPENGSGEITTELLLPKEKVNG